MLKRPNPSGRGLNIAEPKPTVPGKLAMSGDGGEKTEANHMVSMVEKGESSPLAPLGGNKFQSNSRVTDPRLVTRLIRFDSEGEFCKLLGH